MKAVWNDTEIASSDVSGRVAFWWGIKVSE